MSILKRFSDIMASNINALLDKAEDPSKMVDQLLRNLNSDLGKIKSETASVMAEEARARRELDECKAEIGFALFKIFIVLNRYARELRKLLLRITCCFSQVFDSACNFLKIVVHVFLLLSLYLL